MIAEISCPTSYFEEASGISFSRSITYGTGCLWTGLRYRLAKMGLVASPLFPRRPGPVTRPDGLADSPSTRHLR